MTFRPLFASEKLLAGPPYRGCRVSSIYHALGLATNGETALTSSVRTHGKAARTAALKRGWAGFTKGDPGDTWPDRGDVLNIQHAMVGTDLPDPAISWVTTDWAWERIGDYAVSIALNLAAVPSSDALRKYVGAVPHQVVLWQRKITDGTRWVKVIDPMHPHSNLYIGHWCKWASIKKSALAIQDANGRMFVELYPVGGWTAERLMAQKKNAQIDTLGRTIDRKKERIGDLESTVAMRELEVARLTLDLTECEATVPDCADEVENAKAIGRESAFVQVLQSVQSMRSTPEG